MGKKTKSKNYIENEYLYGLIKNWKEKYDVHFEKTGESLMFDDELTKAILLIATRIATRYNFSGYAYKEDMIQDAMYALLRYLRNYDLERTNPHAYITTCCHNAFINRINLETASTIKKYKYYINFIETNSAELAAENIDINDHEILDQMYTRVNDFEKKRKGINSNRQTSEEDISRFYD